MSIWSKWFGRKNTRQQDEPEAEQEKDAREMLGSMGIRLLPGVEVAPEGQGPFGYTAANPIPVNGPVGEFVYLNTLRSPGGQPFFFHRLGCVDCPTYPRMVDAYEVVSWDGRCWARLYFDMYFTRRSLRVPDGLTRVEWDQLDGPQALLVKHCGFGLNQSVKDFPHGLAETVRQGSDNRATEIMARVAERLVAANPNGFGRPVDFEGGLWVAPE